MRELCAEFQSAIAALTTNDLQALKTSIENQERLANKLQSLFQEIPVSQRSPSIPQDVLELIHVTRVYSALLQRSMRTVSLRAALCRTYKQHFVKPAESAPATSWSCEV